LRLDQDDVAVCIGYAEHQDLREERSDLSRWEIHYREDLATEQLIGGVALGQLGARAAAADFGAEVDFELVRRLAGGWKRAYVDDPPNAHVDREKIVESDYGALGHRDDGMPGQ
jgi:hypothetical protein